MRREHRKLTRDELALITSRRPVVWRLTLRSENSKRPDAPFLDPDSPAPVTTLKIIRTVKEAGGRS